MPPAGLFIGTDIGGLAGATVVDFPVRFELVTVAVLVALLVPGVRWNTLDLLLVPALLAGALPVNLAGPVNVGGRDPLAGTRGVEPDSVVLPWPTLGMTSRCCGDCALERRCEASRCNANLTWLYSP